MLTNKEIEILDQLLEKYKDILEPVDFLQLHNIVGNLHKDRDKRRKHAREAIAKKRKEDPTYARPYAQKEKYNNKI